MRHRFETKEVPRGEKEVVESCICGQKRVRYLNNTFVYLDSRGMKNKAAGSCRGEKIEHGFEWTGGLSDTEARLKEAIVFIKLMYEDMMTAGLSVRSRVIAGRFLSSHGYRETVKYLESKT